MLSCFTSSGKRGRPPLRNMLILYSSFISLLSVLCLIRFLYSWPETLDWTLSQTKFLTLPPSLVFQNSLHRQFIPIKYIVSRWSSGNRERATSAREVIEVAGSNHAIGVILNLAWGPNNFSPSMIWSWRSRSNSSPRNLHFSFVVFFLFFSLITILSSFILFFFFFSEKWSYWCIVLFFLVTYIRFWYLVVPSFSFPFLSF